MVVEFVLWFLVMFFVVVVLATVLVLCEVKMVNDGYAL